MGGNPTIDANTLFSEWARLPRGRCDLSYNDDWELPELLITAVSPQRATRLLNAVARDALAGKDVTPGSQIKVPAGPLIEIVEMSRPDAHLNFAVAFGGPEIRALQLVWADGRGRWPWSAAFCDGRRKQPVLGVRAQKA